jgi:hypothetical protein
MLLRLVPVPKLAPPARPGKQDEDGAEQPLMADADSETDSDGDEPGPAPAS